MKKLVFMYLWIAGTCQAQNWQPIHSGNVYNYFSSAAFSSAAVIQSDSVSASGSDTLFYLNRVVGVIPGVTNKKLKHQAQFLGKQVLQRANGLVTFWTINHMTLNVLAPPLAPWVYDSVNHYTASVISIKYDTIFGVSDSMKVIAAMNSDTLVISKQYGIVSFKPAGSGLTYSLRGIQNKGLGYHIPTYKDFYNFNVGDVFEFHKILAYNSYPSAMNYSNNYHWKWTILSKTISGNSLIYSASRVEKDTVKNWATFNYDTKIFSQTDNLVFTDSTTLFQNGYNGENIFVPDSSGIPVLLDKELYFGYDTTFKTSTKSHIQWEYFEALNGDTVSVNSNSSTPDHYYGLEREKICGNGIGLIYYYDVTFHANSGTEEFIWQLGCIKNGIQYGKIIPDSILLATGIPSAGAISSYQVYPTFLSDNTSVHIKGPGMPCEANLYNIAGQRVLSSRLFLSHETEAELDLGSLLPGMYFLQLTDLSGKSFSFKLNKEK